ncbi:MAG: ABC-F family ATP-binding cassette domain-containing protein [Erysipelotrichia bacterium]|nr:ABC-F family ATP-binding cassette domain-containing protein [Erysipelotrichia bacterium]
MRYQIVKGSKAFGAQDVFENISFEVKEKEKVAIVGRNGCGKSTLLKIIAQEEVLDAGVIHKEKSTTIGYLAQSVFSNDEISVEEDFEQVFSELHICEKQLEDISLRMVEDHSEAILNEYAKVQERFEELGGYTYKQEMLNIFTKFNFSIDDLKKKLNEFSGGQKTRLSFVKLLLSKPDILLLDEPTNHLDLETIEWLEGYVKRYPKAVVMVSHDRTFLDNVVDVVYEIEYGVMRKYTGNYSHYVEVKKSDVERQKSAYVRQQKEIQHLEELIEKFRYKASKAKFAQSKIKYLDRMDKIEDRKSDETSFKAHFSSRIKGGNQVLSVRDLTIGYDTPLCRVSFELLRGNRCAVIGKNGTGKSTLIKTLMEKVPALSGDFLLGHQIEVGYFDQELAQFHSSNTVLEELWGLFPELDHTAIRNALGCFLFRGEEVFKEVSVLSGGEKVRLTFAKLMLEHGNFLLMDEPTNHLDVLGKEALEEALKEYDGTLLCVSHDRYFISQIATSILVLDENGATYYPLTYQEYLHKDEVKIANKEVKSEKKKEKPKFINYGREIARLEKKIAKKEEELEELRELRYEPEYYQDSKKMAELDSMIDDVHNEINQMMQLWEEYSEAMES